MSDFEPKLLLNKTLTARVLGISVQAFTNWGLKPHKRTKTEAFFYLPTVIEELLRRRSPDPDAELDLEQERARLAKEQADKTALENAERRSEVLLASEVGAGLDRAFSVYRQRMLGAASKLAPQVNPEKPNVARDIIAREHERILDELADYFAQAASAELADLDGGEDADPSVSAAPNGKRVGKSVSATERGKQRRARTVQH